MLRKEKEWKDKRAVLQEREEKEKRKRGEKHIDYNTA